MIYGLIKLGPDKKKKSIDRKVPQAQIVNINVVKTPNRISRFSEHCLI